MHVGRKMYLRGVPLRGVGEDSPYGIIPPSPLGGYLNQLIYFFIMCAFNDAVVLLGLHSTFTNVYMHT